jgi:hypothetical protein
MFIDLQDTPISKFSPYKGENIIKYKLTAEEINIVYPIKPNGEISITEEEAMAYPDFNKDWDYKKAISQPVFFQIVEQRLHLLLQIQGKDFFQYGMCLAGDERFVGKNVFMSSYSKPLTFKYNNSKGQFYTRVQTKYIMAYEEENKIKPIGNNVLYRAETPAIFLPQKSDSGFEVSDENLKDLTPEKLLDVIRQNWEAVLLGQNSVDVISVGEEVKDPNPGDVGLISQFHFFQLNKVVKISPDKKYIYFIAPPAAIWSKIEK